MSINDKILLQIYPQYTSVYGPYEKRDGRKQNKKDPFCGRPCASKFNNFV